MSIDPVENRKKMGRGELYYSFTSELVAERRQCELACARFNSAGDVSRRERVRMWREIVVDKTTLPPQAGSQEEDEALFEDDPWVLPPVQFDYGSNIKVGAGVFINFNCTILDTCTVTIGSRCLLGPNVSLYSATHPLDPSIRNGIKGPELGMEIRIGDDVWIGGNVIILPGVTLGRGCVVGAGSVVAKDVPDFWVVAGNPARMIRKVETSMDPTHRTDKPADELVGAEKPMADLARDIEKSGGLA